MPDIFPTPRSFRTGTSAKRPQTYWRLEASRVWAGFRFERSDLAPNFPVSTSDIRLSRDPAAAGRPVGGTFRPFLSRRKGHMRSPRADRPQADLPWWLTLKRSARRNAPRRVMLRRHPTHPSHFCDASGCDPRCFSLTTDLWLLAPHPASVFLPLDHSTPPFGLRSWLGASFSLSTYILILPSFLLHPL